MRKVWIEAALNGPWSRKFQPGIPDTVETPEARLFPARPSADIDNLGGSIRQGGQNGRGNRLRCKT